MKAALSHSNCAIHDGHMNIGDIIDAIRQRRLHITDHAQDQAQKDQLSNDDISVNVFQGEVTEDLS